MGKNNMAKFGMGRRSDVVQRAASVASSSDTRSDAERRSQQKFLALVAAVVVAGSLLVGFSWAERQYDHPTVLDSWQNSYGIYDCTADAWLEPFPSQSSESGIRSRGDGIVYIEPADDAFAGSNATIEVFLDGVGAVLDDDRLVLPDGAVLAEADTTCFGEDAVLQVQRWNDDRGDAPVSVRYEDLAGQQFESDGDSFVIALAPAGHVIGPTSAP